MFESSLISALKSDSVLSGILTKYKNDAAVFSELAPEDAALPYIVCRISRDYNDSPAIMEFNVYIDFFDFNKSAASSRVAADRIEKILDRANLQHSRFKTIRFYFFSGGQVVGDDPRNIHHNLQFTARAGRMGWCDYKTTEE
jgi:hypothetical protein